MDHIKSTRLSSTGAQDWNGKLPDKVFNHCIPRGLCHPNHSDKFENPNPSSVNQTSVSNRSTATQRWDSPCPIAQPFFRKRPAKTKNTLQQQTLNNPIHPLIQRDLRGRCQEPIYRNQLAASCLLIASLTNKGNKCTFLWHIVIIRDRDALETYGFSGNNKARLKFPWWISNPTKRSW